MIQWATSRSISIFVPYEDKTYKTQEDCSKLFDFAAKEFDKERQKWDIVYPDKPATLVIHKDYGPRLILHFLPGKTLNWWLNNIEHGDTLTESRVWLALAYAFKNLASKGLYPSDTIGNNVLVDRQEDGSFQAYVIDFGGVSYCDCNIATTNIGDATEELTGHKIDLKDCKNYEVIISRLENHITFILDAQQSLFVRQP